MTISGLLMAALFVAMLAASIFLDMKTADNAKKKQRLSNASKLNKED